MCAAEKKPVPEKLTREWVREHLPNACAIADDFASVFGADTKMCWAAEDGYEVGEKTDESKYQVVTGADLTGCVPLIDTRKKEGK